MQKFIVLIVFCLCACSASPGAPGSPGVQGTMGEMGERGEMGAMGLPGSKGDPGEPGEPGVTSIDLSVVMPGNKCAHGGVKITTNSQVGYVCNGAPGAKGKNGQDGVDGVNGNDGMDGVGASYVWVDNTNTEFGPVSPRGLHTYMDGLNFVWQFNAMTGELAPVSTNIDVFATSGIHYYSGDCTGPGYLVDPGTNIQPMTPFVMEGDPTIRVIETGTPYGMQGPFVSRKSIKTGMCSASSVSGLAVLESQTVPVAPLFMPANAANPPLHIEAR